MLPLDPQMLLSVINMKLRDFYSSLDALCEDLDEDEATKNRIRAAEIILDRGYGKPVQAVDLDASSVPQVVFVGDVPD